jgi:hypothetical protein
MWLSLGAVAAGGLAGLLTGGRIDNLRHVRLHWVAVLLAGAVCEFVGSRWGSGGVGLAVLLAGYVLLVAFALRNFARPGLVLIGAGLLANLLVIGLDRGMPVRGLPPGVTDGPRHHGIRPGDHLTGLADVVHLGPIGQTVSAGDLVLAVGIATAAAAALRTRPGSGRGLAGSSARPSHPAGNMDRWPT